MVEIILVKDFCSLKIKNTQFCNGFCFNQFPINVEQILNTIHDPNTLVSYPLPCPAGHYNQLPLQRTLKGS